MKIKALLAVFLVAGFASSLALGATGRRGDDGTTTSSTTTSTVERPKCKPVALGGKASAGSVAFTATRTSKNAAKLANTTVTLTIPAGARIVAVACTDANGALTLRQLHVGAK